MSCGSSRVVRPDEVLGLTFTRKAAGELSERLAARLATLREAGLWTPDPEDGAAVLDDAPTVSTYHAYAGRIVREHGLRLGVEPESRLLTRPPPGSSPTRPSSPGTARWTRSTRPSRPSPPPSSTSPARWPSTSSPPPRSRTLAEVVATLEALTRPDGSRKRTSLMRDVVGVLRQRAAVVPLVGAYHALKRSRDAMDFADQMALAAQLATTVPEVGAPPSVAGSGRSSSTSSRTPPRPSCSCSARSSWRPANRCPSPPSATRTSRSTAGGGRPRPGTRPLPHRLPRPRPGAGPPPLDELAQRPRRPRRRQRRRRAARGHRRVDVRPSPSAPAPAPATSPSPASRPSRTRPGTSSTG